ncbi:hypothetical protein JGS22_024715 [Streptomyces sp. P38-E01]|uniref:Uncharacterized protein n=1 Tax=Streptomyces tardus TaxID=2780544 RepID=A0A949NAJ9_9ACTN|nr:hypothetical protein [Streptomyces tardus]MBU7600741.1 hypothetical protein [Streptomyces tardus]
MPWAIVRRPWVVLAALVAYVALLLFVRDDVVNVPSITMRGSAGIKLMNFLPMIPLLGLLYCLERRLGHAEATAVRPVVAADRALVVATGGAAVMVGLVFNWAYGMDNAVAAARNVILLVGLALLVRAWYGAHAAAAASVGALFLTVVTGLQAPQKPYPWAVLLEPASTPHAAAAGALMLLVGLAAMGRNRVTTP